MEKIFKGKVAIITGGSFGIGQATAIAFSKRGARVVVADWMEDKENNTIKLIKNFGGDAIFIRCDVSSCEEVKDMIKKVIARFRRIDFAFNNAGIEGIPGNTHECAEGNWDKTIGINLKGVWLCMKNEIPEMLKNNSG